MSKLAEAGLTAKPWSVSGQKPTVFTIWLVEASLYLRIAELTGKKAPQEMVWTYELDGELRYLEHALSSAPVLTIPWQDDVFVSVGHWCLRYSYWAILSVRWDKEDFPVAYHSKKLLRDTVYYHREGVFGCRQSISALWNLPGGSRLYSCNWS